MKNSKKSKWLDNALRVMPYYCLCINEKQLKAKLKHLKIEHSQLPKLRSNAVTHIFDNNKTGRYTCIVYFDYKKHKSMKLNDIYALLVHEGVHVYQQCKQWMNEKEAGIEFEAYTIQSISLSLFNEFSRLTK